MSTTGTPSAASAHILIVDDDDEVVSLLQRYLGSHGYRISTASDGNRMRQIIVSEAVDLILLDLGLPGDDGLDLTRELRREWHGAVIIVSGRGESVDRVVGLELGADDYVAKPFDLRELLARVRSVLRRAAPARVALPEATAKSDSRLTFAGFVMDMRSRTLAGPTGDIPLTTGEFDLLCVFVGEPGRVLSRDDLMSRLHGREAGPYDRAIDMQITRLRRKIEVDSSKPALLKSVRGAGYLFAAEVSRS
ncbi:response regulator [Tahibacter amnicola]|uniref:Response regulator n=1 Tax=Tahibacter amnicola TaxID=2976241 RepID=A0ABY6BBD2_9GAMM|nr:response regulator [Tahibacter amnicola]UXI66463.1 response regulator [Tahibacter amnicola]